MSNKYVLELRHRPHPDDDIGSRHARFVERQAGVDDPWCIPSDGRITPPSIAGELSSIVDLDKILGPGLKGEIVYQFRGRDYLRDAAQYDDNVAIEFNPRKIDYLSLVKKVFPKMVEAFECYRATIYEKSVARSDWREIVKLSRETGRDINGRDGVFRINAVNFYDRELCVRAFGLPPEEIVGRLQDKVEDVSLLMGGVLLIFSSSLLEGEDFTKIDSAVKEILK